MTCVKDLFPSRAPTLLPIPTGLFPSGKLDHPVQCVLLDVYGTLFISASGDIHAFESQSSSATPLGPLLKKYNVPDPPEILVKRLVAAIEQKHAELRAHGVDFPEVEIDKIWEGLLPIKEKHRIRTFAAEFEMLTNPVCPMPHLGEMLEGMKEKGVLLGIVSNAQFYTPCLFEGFLGAPLETLGFLEELTLFSYAFGRAKPSAALFDKARRRLEKRGIPPHGALYVGNDMLKDIIPAHRAGFKTALFAGDARSLRLRKSDPRCKEVAPDLVVTDLLQLLDHV